MAVARNMDRGSFVGSDLHRCLGRVPYVGFGCLLVIDLVLFCLLHETVSLSRSGFRMHELTAREVLSLCLVVLLRLVRVPCPDPLLNLWFEVDIDYVNIFDFSSN